LMTAAADAVVSVNGLVKRFGRKAILNAVDMHVYAREIVAVVGPNGAGKTTLLRIVSSLMRPTSGDVYVDGYHLPEEAAAICRRLGVVSHQTSLYGDLTSQENLMFHGRLYNLDQIDSRISNVLDQIGLTSRRNDLVRTFSRGMQQRLSIGLAVLHEPVILLLDEPFTGLDREGSDMLGTFLTTASVGGCAVIMTSHDLFGVEKLADRFVFLSQGKVASSMNRNDLPAGGLPSAYRRIIRPASDGGSD
jgi:heme exporter protein A